MRRTGEEHGAAALADAEITTGEEAPPTALADQYVIDGPGRGRPCLRQVDVAAPYESYRAPLDADRVALCANRSADDLRSLVSSA